MDFPRDVATFIVVVQIVASANSAYDIPWPPQFKALLSVMRVFLVDVVSLTRTASCAQPMTFYSSLALLLIGFKVMLVLLIVMPWLLDKVAQTYTFQRFQALRRLSKGARLTRATVRQLAAPSMIIRQRRQQADKNGSGASGSSDSSEVTARMPMTSGASVRGRGAVVLRRMSGVVTGNLNFRVQWLLVFKATFMILFVAYPGVSLKIFQLFHCRRVEGVDWLVADMRLRCYTPEWTGFAFYALVMAVMYIVGLPTTVFVLLWRRRHSLFNTPVADSTTATKASNAAEVVANQAAYGFLYTVYGPSAWWWEVEELLRKLLLSAVVVLVDSGSPLQVRRLFNSACCDYCTAVVCIVALSFKFLVVQVVMTVMLLMVVIMVVFVQGRGLVALYDWYYR